MAEKKRKTGMSDEHKQALAEGRRQGRAVRVYLEALDANKPKRGRKRTIESVKKRLNEVDRSLNDARAEERLLLTQERFDLLEELSGMQEQVDLSALEADFVVAAGDYSRRKGISYAAWREVGVPPAVLKKAGIGRGQ
jgi:hypothetical protein